MEMEQITISLAAQVAYKFCGLFESRSPDWIHMSRNIREYELIVVTKGTLFIADDTQEYSIHENEYLFMTGHQHGFAPSQCTFYWLHFENPLLGMDNEPIFTIPVTGTIYSINRMKECFSQLSNAEFRYHDATTNNLYTMNILRELHNQWKERQLASHSFKDYLLQNVKNYIKWNQAYHLTVNNLADYFGYHPKYLSTIFHKETGIPLKQFLINETMECAKIELCNTNHTIQNIALSLGFCDGHAFSHAFKRHTGMTPTQYRNSHPPIYRNSN